MQHHLQQSDHDRRDDAFDDDVEPVINRTAQRVLDLFINLNVASAPLSTSQIIGNADLGYRSKNEDSAKKQFKRDRETLLSHGIVIAEVPPASGNEADESSWTIDHEHTDAKLSDLSTDELEQILSTSVRYDQNLLWTGNHALQELRSRVQTELSRRRGDPFPQVIDAPPSTAEGRTIDRLWSCFEDHNRVRFSYQNARGQSREHEIDIYGFFTLEGHVYLVGYSPAHDATLTFRTDRVTNPKRLKDAYTIPGTFSIEDYLFLPFDFSRNDPVMSMFSFSPTVGSSELQALSQGRGTLERNDEGWTWTVPVRDLEAAASFALENASIGMRPVEPMQLVSAWNTLIRKAVDVHERA